MEPKGSLPQSQEPATYSLTVSQHVTFFTMRSCWHLAHPHKHEDHSLSAIRDYLFNIFAATLHVRGLSFIRNLRTRHGVVTGTHLSQPPDGIQSHITFLPCESLYRQLMLVGMIFYAYLTPHCRATKKCFCRWHSGKIDCLLNKVSYSRV